MAMLPPEEEAGLVALFGPKIDANGVRYTSIWSRMLAWVVFLPPFNWVGNMQTQVSSAQLKQIFNEYDAEPISVGLILRGPQAPQSWPASFEPHDASK